MDGFNGRPNEPFPGWREVVTVAALVGFAAGIAGFLLIVLVSWLIDLVLR